MFAEDEDINSDIKDDAKLWCYMDFTKLVSLLSTSTYLHKVVLSVPNNPANPKRQ
ncbi:hypothetical protein IG3_05733 [Bacillus cereus HuA2-1]|uniref:Uncharacterized protein n=1 Tax=Bacillus cereus HuA2-1 TaxID=1053201 RepID=J9B6M8_BACCE|nr:hypothetical protein IG3_05733 [Bacillus cereus HuA2-1]